LTDNNDADADGIPDLTDSSSSSSTQVSLDGWNYHAWPWTYNETDEDWLYYYNGASGWAVWRNKDKSWYTFDATSKTWSAL
jgi:hypothetical protein